VHVCYYVGAGTSAALRHCCKSVRVMLGSGHHHPLYVCMPWCTGEQQAQEQGVQGGEGGPEDVEDPPVGVLVDIKVRVGGVWGGGGRARMECQACKQSWQASQVFGCCSICVIPGLSEVASPYTV
jgi:hypothetical protein